MPNYPLSWLVWLDSLTTVARIIANDYSGIIIVVKFNAVKVNMSELTTYWRMRLRACVCHIINYIANKISLTHIAVYPPSVYTCLLHRLRLV